MEFVRTGDEKLRHDLIESHLGLAYHLARRFRGSEGLDDDLFQVASVALVNSVDRFDPERGVAFSTFATRTILGELKRYLRDKTWAVKAPRRMQELCLEVGQITETLTHEFGRAPTVVEISEVTGNSEEAVLEALEAGRNYRTASIDAADHDSRSLAEQIGDVDVGYARSDRRIDLDGALAHLPRRQRNIVSLRFVEELTQSEIADRLGISQMHVSRLLAKSFEVLRDSLVSAA